MPIPQITTTRNGSGATVGYREDLAQGDTMVASLTNTIGVTGVRWELIGRPEGSTAGGAGPEPILLANALTAAFTVDIDTGSFRTDGTYTIQATINPGAPGERRVQAILCRLSGVTIPALGGGLRFLRKLGGFETLEDTSIAVILLGWATQLNRWLELIRILAIGGGGGGGGGGGPVPIAPMEDSTGAEVVQDQTQLLVNMDEFGGTVGIVVAGTGFSEAGTATVRVYLAGTDGNDDGTEVAAVSMAVGTNKRTTSGTFPNPGGFQYVIFTIQSSAAGKSAQYRDVTLVIQ